MKYIIQFICFTLFVLMACSDDGGPASNGATDDMARFSRLHEGFRTFAEIEESMQFSTLSPGFTFGSDASCGSAYVEVDNGFSGTTYFDLSSGECFELNFDGEPYFYLFNYAPLDNGLTLMMTLEFYGRPLTREYNLNCIISDCDDVALTMRIIDSAGQEVIHFHGMPNVLSITSSSNQVTATFDGLFYPDDFDEGGSPFNVAGTLVCCH